MIWNYSVLTVISFMNMNREKDLNISTWRNPDGSVNIGILIDAGIIMAMPFLIFKTWAEYVSFITKQCNFIELEYEREVAAHAMTGALNTFVNSLEQIDKVK